MLASPWVRRKHIQRWNRPQRRKGTRSMTTCVAAVCNDGKAIILAADKMIGFGSVESEPDISKIRSIHKNWRVMIAGDGIEPAFSIIDAAYAKLNPIPAPRLDVVIEEMELAWQEKRLHDSVACFLTPLGWKLDDFKRDGQKLLGEVAASKIRDAMEAFEFSLELLVAGFDDQGEGRIFSLTKNSCAIGERHDMGFHAVGSGSDNANFIMTYRRVAPKMTLREALFYTLEGKYYGELASGVGERTDIVVMRPNEEDLIIHEDNVEILINRICAKVDPRELSDTHILLLNRLPELDGIADAMPLPSIDERQRKADEAKRTKWSKNQKKKP